MKNKEREDKRRQNKVKLINVCVAGKDDSPAMTMHAKLKEPKKFQTPAPNKYEVYKYTNY